MAKFLIDEETLTDIARAIREKMSVGVFISPSKFAAYIRLLGDVDFSECGAYLLPPPVIEDEKDEDLYVSHMHIDTAETEGADYPTHHEVYLNGSLRETFECGPNFHYVPYEEVYGTGNAPRQGDEIHVCSIIMENGVVVARSGRSNSIVCIEYDSGSFGWQ